MTAQRVCYAIVSDPVVAEVVVPQREEGTSAQRPLKLGRHEITGQNIRHIAALAAHAAALNEEAGRSTQEAGYSYGLSASNSASG